MAILDTTARIQTCETGWRIAVGDDVSAEFDFGEGGEFAAPNGKRYLGLVDLPDGGDEAQAVESGFEYWLYEVTPVDVEPEELDGFDGEDGGGDEDEDALLEDDEDDEDGEETPEA
jgi:hypothetical protein